MQQWNVGSTAPAVGPGGWSAPPLLSLVLEAEGRPHLLPPAAVQASRYPVPSCGEMGVQKIGLPHLQVRAELRSPGGLVRVAGPQAHQLLFPRSFLPSSLLTCIEPGGLGDNKLPALQGCAT